MRRSISIKIRHKVPAARTIRVNKLNSKSPIGFPPFRFGRGARVRHPFVLLFVVVVGLPTPVYHLFRHLRVEVLNEMARFILFVDVPL